MASSIDELLQDPAFRAKFLELLDRDPAFREEVRRKLLSEELLALPERMEQFRREMEEAIARLRQEMNEQFRRVWEVVEQNNRQIAALTVRMERVEEQMEKHTEELRSISQSIGRMQERWGLLHEDLAEDQMPYILERSQRIVRRIAKVQYDGEVDLVLEVEEANGFRFTLVLEVKGRVFSSRPFEQILQRLADADFLNWLRREGFPEPYVPAVFAMALYGRIETVAQDLGVGLYDPKRGEIFIPPLSTSA
ncbi:MAG: hypothetical protein N3E46_00665 [Gemmataceae bacterium]|jgi:seryl-tRNA synthetase|nr:hypothetical protein [Gemmataceae bacterium]